MFEIIMLIFILTFWIPAAILASRLDKETHKVWTIANGIDDAFLEPAKLKGELRKEVLHAKDRS
jgi:hypothetical protein